MRAVRARPFGTRSGGVTATAASCPGTQLANAFGELRDTAREVVRRVNRGVVAYSSLTD